MAKYLFFGMVLLLIFGILRMVGFPPGWFLQFLFAGIVSFLSTAYLTPSEVLTVLIAYDTLGMVLTTIVPFVILLLFSATLLAPVRLRDITVSKIVFEVVLWFLFAFFLVLRVIRGWDTILRAEGIAIATAAVAILTFFILFFNGTFRKWIGKIGIEIMRTRGRVEREAARLSGQAAREWEQRNP